LETCESMDWGCSGWGGWSDPETDGWTGGKIEREWHRVGSFGRRHEAAGGSVAHRHCGRRSSARCQSPSWDYSPAVQHRWNCGVGWVIGGVGRHGTCCSGGIRDVSPSLPSLEVPLPLQPRILGSRGSEWKAIAPSSSADIQPPPLPSPRRQAEVSAQSHTTHRRNAGGIKDS